MDILVINAGSSSLKYQFFNMKTHEVLAKGLCERIGIEGSRVKHAAKGKEKFEKEIAMKTHAEAIRVVTQLMTSPEYGVIKSMSEIEAVGHRIVSGGEFFDRSVLVDDEVIEKIAICNVLAPLHNPHHLTGINACKEVMPGVPQVVTFDTAFHQSMPIKAYLYALPYEYYEKYKVRRYGAHGTSHRYVAGRAAQMMGRPVEQLKIITCHLGNGSSITAVDGGRSVDTSMGLTPLAGVPMGTRSGSLDPAILGYVMERENLDIQQMTKILNEKSGVLGISGVSSDFRDLDAAVLEGNKRAEAALDIFVYAVKKYIGAYAAAMGGVDAVVFTAGIGENNARLRERIVDGLGFMGIKLDQEKNKVTGEEKDVTADGSKVKLFVVPTNEELVIALDTEEIVSALRAGK